MRMTTVAGLTQLHDADGIVTVAFSADRGTARDTISKELTPPVKEGLEPKFFDD